MQAQALPNETIVGTGLTDMTGRIVQQPTVIATEWNGAATPLPTSEGHGAAADVQGLAGRLQSIPAGGELAANTVPTQQMMQAQIPVHESAIAGSLNGAQISDASSSMQGTGHPAMTKSIAAANAAELGKAMPAAEPAKGMNMIPAEAGEALNPAAAARPEHAGSLGEPGKAMQQQAPGQAFAEPARESELNHSAAALKGGSISATQTGVSVQVEPAQAEVRAPAYTQIEKAIASTLQNQGPKEFRLQLQPESLGMIDIKLKLEANKMTIEIMAAGAKTQALLTGQVDKLVQGLGLQMHNVQIESVQVSSREAELSSQQQQSFTANEHADMFQGREQQMQPEHIGRMGSPSMAGSESEASVSAGFDEGAKYRLNYSV